MMVFGHLISISIDFMIFISPFSPKFSFHQEDTCISDTQDGV